MKISLNWISDFVDLKDVDYKELIKKFTLATAEVEEVYEVGKDIDGIIVAKVVSCENHPQSNHLHILKVLRTILTAALAQLVTFVLT